jgi:mRNA interferase MazF
LVSGKKVNGAVLSDHLKSLDWRTRKAKLIEKASKEIVEECALKISALILASF